MILRFSYDKKTLFLNVIIEYAYKALYMHLQLLPFPEAVSAVFLSGDCFPAPLMEILQTGKKKILDGVRAAAFRPLADILYDLDPQLVKGAFAGEHFDEYFFADCKDEELAKLVRKLKYA